ncbi:hypothetical protein KAW96_03560 [candidate division WOR-3 bacterium]|nr:hypothetical protein [candidate division WOR-3 bacterium]
MTRSEYEIASEEIKEEYSQLLTLPVIASEQSERGNLILTKENMGLLRKRIRKNTRNDSLFLSLRANKVSVAISF